MTTNLEVLSTSYTMKNKKDPLKSRKLVKKIRFFFTIVKILYFLPFTEDLVQNDDLIAEIHHNRRV